MDGVFLKTGVESILMCTNEIADQKTSVEKAEVLGEGRNY